MRSRKPILKSGFLTLWLALIAAVIALVMAFVLGMGGNKSTTVPTQQAQTTDPAEQVLGVKSLSKTDSVDDINKDLTTTKFDAIDQDVQGLGPVN